MPALEGLDLIADIELEAEGNAALIDIPRLSLSMRDKDTWLSLNGFVSNLDHTNDSIEINLERISANFNAPATLSILSSLGDKERALARKLTPLASLGDINLLGRLAADNRSLDFNGSVITTAGSIDIDAGIMRDSPRLPSRSTAQSQPPNSTPLGFFQLSVPSPTCRSRPRPTCPSDAPEPSTAKPNSVSTTPPGTPPLLRHHGKRHLCRLSDRRRHRQPHPHGRLLRQGRLSDERRPPAHRTLCQHTQH